MKIKLKHEKLAKSLQYTSKAVNQKPNIPVLSNVLLDINKNGLRLSATNLDMGINVWIPGVVEQEGMVTVSAKFIADFVSAMSGDNVDLSLEGTVVNVKTEKSKANFNTIPASEFPVLPRTSQNPLFSISSKEFLVAMDKVLFACSTDLSAGKIQQSGVLFEFDRENEEIIFVGLDGFRLSKRTSKISNLPPELPTEQIIVPARYLGELVKIMQDYVELEDIEVYLSESKSQIIFKFEEIEFSIRLLEGPYPDYKRIMPDSDSYTFEVKKHDLESAIRVVNTFARSNLGYKTLFDLDLENSVVKLKSVVAEVGDNETVINVTEVHGESDLNTSYNLKYIQDVVAHIKGDSIIYETKGPLAASVFKDKSDARFVHLLMPLRRDA
jgi:DNA polymerase III subunit beta